MFVESAGELIKLILRAVGRSLGNGFELALFLTLVFIMVIFVIIMGLNVLILLRAKENMKLGPFNGYMAAAISFILYTIIVQYVTMFAISPLILYFFYWIMTNKNKTEKR